MVLSLKAWESRSLPGLQRTIGLDVEIQKPSPETVGAFVFSRPVRDGVVVRLQLDRPAHVH